VQALQCNYFDDPGDRHVLVDGQQLILPSNFTPTWLQDPKIECYKGAHVPFALFAIIVRRRASVHAARVSMSLTVLCSLSSLQQFGVSYVFLAFRLLRARTRLVGVRGGFLGFIPCLCSRDAVSRPDRGVAAFERSHPLM
jgi:hypothetical protein